ncbi:MAG: guanylate kinase [Candidatus Caenarcaniphilales bacterium]|jgi:guanylate kinase|nr:guanylate kinase [Candidatus Caenarcaniphilales bacterium]
MINHKNNLIVFTGPSGVGKGTIVKKLFEQVQGIEFSVSCTTREKREGEVDGKNYFFKTREEFENMITNNELLEHAEFVGNHYGTPKAFVEKTLAEGKDVFLEIEVQGALQIMQKFPEAITIFLVPPKFEVLEERLRKRGTESEEVLQKRLTKAQEEMGFMDMFEYIVVNDDIDQAVKLLEALIMQARIDVFSGFTEIKAETSSSPSL